MKSWLIVSCLGVAAGASAQSIVSPGALNSTEGNDSNSYPFSAPLLAGTVLEYDGGLGGKGFEFRNPQVEAGCGCGRSFQVNPEALEALG